MGDDLHIRIGVSLFCEANMPYERPDKMKKIEMKLMGVVRDTMEKMGYVEGDEYDILSSIS